MLGYPALNHVKFLQYLSSLDIGFKPIPPHRPSKNVLESKHDVIRSIFLILMRDDAMSTELAAMQAVCISNDLYGSDVISDFDMAKGFIRAITISSQVSEIDSDVIDAQLQLEANYKFTMILRSKAITYLQVQVGDLVEVFVNRDRKKNCNWLTPRSVLEIYRSSGTLTVFGSMGRTLKAAIKSAGMALEEDSFSSMV